MESQNLKTIRFSVVIPTYHRNDLLAKCLDCLAPGVQTLPKDQYEVIVSDDGYETTAEEMVKQNYPWAKWVAGPRKGPAANRNNGAKFAQGEWLAFTDDDCLPDPQWLDAYEKATKEPVLAFEGAIHPIGNLDRDLTECPVNISGGCFWSANILVQRALFETVNGFDPKFPIAAHEDQDLKIRLEQMTKILFVPEAIVRHPVRLQSFNKAVKEVPKRCYVFAYYAKKHKYYLGYKTIFHLLFFQYLFYLRSIKHNIVSKKYFKALLSVYTLLIGVPLTAFFYVLHHPTDQE